MQFSLGSLVCLGVAASVLMAFWANPSMLSFGFLVASYCMSLILSFPKYRKYPVLVGASVGTFVSTCLISALVLVVVVDGPRYQGQLYHEDGPEVFFFVAAFIWLVGSMIAGCVGMLIGVLIDLFVSGMSSFE